MKTIEIKDIDNYSLAKSLDCLERMGKLFPIVRTNLNSCRMFVDDKRCNCLLEVTQISNTIKVTILLGQASEIDIDWLIEKVRDVFDLDNPIYNEFYSNLNAYGDVNSRELLKSLNGLRLIKDISLMNCVFRTIISQQVSLKVASNMVKKFVKRYGHRLYFDGVYYYQFPNFEFIANNLTISQLREIGIPARRANAIIDVSSKILELDNSLEDYSFRDLEELLISVKGIGQWTVEMLGLFYFMVPDTIPVADLGLHRAVEHLYKLPARTVSKTNVKEFTNRWCGNKSLLVYYIWEFWMLSKVDKEQNYD